MSATDSRSDGRRFDRSPRAPDRFPPMTDEFCDDGNHTAAPGDLSPMHQCSSVRAPSPRSAATTALRSRVGTRRAFANSAVVLVTLALAACGGGDSTSTGATRPLSAAAERGRRTALDAGCASCHGASWQGGVAPAWVGLAGSTVILSDGSTVTADATYLARSITAPADEKVRGYNVAMPPNALTADQVADVVAFIQALTPSEDA